MPFNSLSLLAFVVLHHFFHFFGESLHYFGYEYYSFKISCLYLFVKIYQALSWLVLVQMFFLG